MNEPIRPRSEIVRERASEASAAMKVAILEAQRAGKDDLALKLMRIRDEWGRVAVRGLT